MPPFRHFDKKPELKVDPPKKPLWSPCPTCEGMGRTKTNAKCPRCKGTGVYPPLEGKA